MNRRNYLYTLLVGMIAAPFTLLLRKKEDFRLQTSDFREEHGQPTPKSDARSPKPDIGDAVFWQIDPDKCTQCGRCETECILSRSAVKCVHQYESCGYCLFCSGYYHDNRARFDTAGENLRCPTDAIIRTYIEDPYYEYVIDEAKCVGCGKCVKGCKSFGNGSLFLQVRRGLCKNCNQCRIASVCPSDAFTKTTTKEPYLFKCPSQPEP